MPDTDCSMCRSEDASNTAYMINHEKYTEVCSSCKEMLENRDIDEYTHKALQALCNAVNGKNTQTLADSMLRSIGREHRYLQNELFQALHKFFVLYGAQDENHRDARNEWAVQVAKRWEKASYD